MCLINVAQEYFLTQAGKMSKPALTNFMRLRGRGAEDQHTWLRAEKKIHPKQTNLKSKLPRGGETNILHCNIVCGSIFSQK